MNYIGDFAEDYTTLEFMFTSFQFSTGAPFTLAGTPAVSVYATGSTTQSTAGVTLTVDYDGVTGLNHVLIDLSSDAFYATGKDYEVVITTGIVDGVSVVGKVVAKFSIENRFVASAAIADQVLDEMLDDHALDGSFGKYVGSLPMASAIATQVMTSLGSGTQVFGHSYLAAIKRIEVASGNSTLTGAGTGTEVLTSEDSSLTATYTVDGSGNISAIVWA